MPNFDRTNGIELKKNEACTTCRNYPDNCNVMSDFRLEGKDAKWQGTTIVLVGQAQGREGYLECQMYSKLTPREELPDHPDVKMNNFGKVDSLESAEYYFTAGKKVIK
jgi:hypothetical protein